MCIATRMRVKCGDILDESRRQLNRTSIVLSTNEVSFPFKTIYGMMNDVQQLGNRQFPLDNSPSDIPPPCTVRVRVRSWVSRVRVGSVG